MKIHRKIDLNEKGKKKKTRMEYEHSSISRVFRIRNLHENGGDYDIQRKKIKKINKNSKKEKEEQWKIIFLNMLFNMMV